MTVGALFMRTLLCVPALAAVRVAADSRFSTRAPACMVNGAACWQWSGWLRAVGRWNAPRIAESPPYPHPGPATSTRSVPEPPHRAEHTQKANLSVRQKEDLNHDSLVGQGRQTQRTNERPEPFPEVIHSPVRPAEHVRGVRTEVADPRFHRRKRRHEAGGGADSKGGDPGQLDGPGCSAALGARVTEAEQPRERREGA